MDPKHYKTRKRKLATVTLLRLVVFFVFIMLVIDLVVGFVLQNEVLNIYQDFSFSYADILAKNVDGDRIEQYLKTGETDDYYNNISSVMNSMVSIAGLRYLYVFVPEEEGIRYVWDAQADDDSRPLKDIWYYDGYYPEEEAFEAYRTGEKMFFTYSYGDLYMAAAIAPIYNSEGKTIALAESDILMPHIHSGTTRILVQVLLSVFLLMVLTMVFFYTFVRKRIISPLRKLTIAANYTADNPGSTDELSIDVQTGDEIETLARSFENMNSKLHEYIKENARIILDKQRVNTELRLAAKLQSDSLPGKYPVFSGRDDIRIYADMMPAKEVGGDFYDFFFTDQDHLVIIMADVSGKGIPAAMFMMMAKSTLRSCTMAVEGSDPGSVLFNVNNIICSSNPEMMFVTVWMGILDVRSGVLTAANAGHEKPLLYHRGGEFEIVNDDHGAVIGIMKDLVFPNYELKLKPGSKILVYTDGVTEAMDASEEEFGMERTLKAVNSAPDGEPEDMLMLIDKNIYLFAGNVDQSDDITMLCLEYTKG